MALLALIAGLLLSGTAAYYSIIGLIAIFPGAVLPITLMGASLEFAKLVAASWLYRSWDIAPKVIKIYFVFAVIILMFITSLGTFGYLSKVHLESSVSVADKSIEIARIEQQIANEQRQLDNAQKAIDNLENASATSIFDASKVRAAQRDERNELKREIDDSSTRIDELNLQLVPLKVANAQVEAKVGPLKYIAELIYGKEEAKNYFDSAVRFVIILIVLVFDPLAVLLLIAANISYNQSKLKVDDDDNVIEEQPKKAKKKNYIIEKIETVKAKKKKKVDKTTDVEYNKKKDGDIYNFIMRDDFGIQHTDKVNKNESTRKVKEKYDN
jgi:hypothetical protein